jgi:hypothetical protein
LEHLTTRYALKKSDLDYLQRAPCLHTLNLSEGDERSEVTYEELRATFYRSQLQKITLRSYVFADQRVKSKSLEKKGLGESMIYEYLLEYLTRDSAQIVLAYSRWFNFLPVAMNWSDEVV